MENGRKRTNTGTGSYYAEFSYEQEEDSAEEIRKLREDLENSGDAYADLNLLYWLARQQALELSSEVYRLKAELYRLQTEESQSIRLQEEKGALERQQQVLFGYLDIFIGLTLKLNPSAFDEKERAAISNSANPMAERLQCLFFNLIGDPETYRIAERGLHQLAPLSKKQQPS
ncbi:MAG TPA: hypothetical protein VFQ60_04440 [Patescibacteria group bacterium]|nr:hypothetical protein [Patescibacteria group bacterium]